jgi:hypothetical protein
VACEARTSVTAGTIFDRTRTPLTRWFHACWLFATSKDGISAQSLQRTLEIGSYQTAWAMLHRLRSALLRPGRDLLSGIVQVDETYIGGDEPGLRGGRARGKTVLTAIAVEIREPRGLGRCRMSPVADGSAASYIPLSSTTSSRARPWSLTVGRDTAGLDQIGYVHQRHSQRAARAHEENPDDLLPGVHRVAALAKRWLLGTLWGSRIRLRRLTCSSTHARPTSARLACLWPGVCDRRPDVPRTTATADHRWEGSTPHTWCPERPPPTYRDPRRPARLSSAAEPGPPQKRPPVPPLPAASRRSIEANSDPDQPLHRRREQPQPGRRQARRLRQ